MVGWLVGWLVHFCLSLRSTVGGGEATICQHRRLGKVGSFATEDGKRDPIEKYWNNFTVERGKYMEWLLDCVILLQ